MTTDNGNINFLDLPIEDSFIVPISDEPVLDLSLNVPDESDHASLPKLFDDSPNQDDHIQMMQINELQNANSESHPLNEGSIFIPPTSIIGNEYIQSSTINNQNNNEECALNVHSNIHLMTNENGHDSLEGANQFTDMMMTMQEEDHHAPCEQMLNSTEEVQNDEYNYINDALNESEEYLIYDYLI